jgi:hypothetical protein
MIAELFRTHGRHAVNLRTGITPSGESSLLTDNHREIRLKQLDGLRGLAALLVFLFRAIVNI